MNLLTQVLLLVCSVSDWPEITCQVASWAECAVVAELVYDLLNAPPLRQPGARIEGITRRKLGQYARYPVLKFQYSAMAHRGPKTPENDTLCSR